MEYLNNFLSLNYENINEETQEEIYILLTDFNINDFPKKSLRQILNLALNILKFKGGQVIDLKNQINQQTDAEDEKLNKNNFSEEADRFKQLIIKLESEKLQLKAKLKDMSEEIVILQNRIHEISVNESDKDSNDPLSELDKHEELLKKISTKNKHIKRLIRDLEFLQTQNIEQSQNIIELDKKIKKIALEKLELQNKIDICENEKNQFKDHINELTSEISRLESNVTYLEEEREKADFELKDFIEKLEDRAKAWRKLIDEKERQLDSLKVKYESLKTDYPRKNSNGNQENEIDKLVEAVQERDGMIEELELKIKKMAEEMISSTKLMNEISAERETEKLRDLKNNRSCCKVLQSSLNTLQQRYKELSEMMEKLEEDNILKSKQADTALKTLGEIQNGDNSLRDSIRKLSHLERKLASRDKQIKTLIMEINSLHELSQENSVLRERLNIPHDAIVLTSNLIAKERNKDKILERVTLKLRASEEMRLQLKLEKTELKKEIIELRKKTADRQFDNHLNYKECMDDEKEIGKVRNEIFCDNCLKNIQSIPNQENIIKDITKEWENKYSEVVEENENLRVGMHEILEKIRDYDTSSDHITIDCSILEKVLHALDARSISGWYHPAMRMQNELIAVKEREHALKEKIMFVEKSSKILESNNNNVKSKSKISLEDKIFDESLQINKQGQIEEVEQEDESPKIKSIEKSEIAAEDGPNLKEKTTDLVTMFVERSFEQESYKNEINKLLEKNRNMQVENETLKIYKTQFLEFVEEMKKSENEIGNYCSSLVERLTEIDLQLKREIKKYEFLKEDFDKNLTDFKISETLNLTLIADLKKQINNKKQEINLLKLIENRKKSAFVSTDEVLHIKQKFSIIENRLSNLISSLFRDKNNMDLNNEINMNFGIINDDMQLDFLTIEEYDNIRKTNKILAEDNDKLKINCDQLEEFLEISKEQLLNQQKLISEITDNHIDLRHLVADLQSSSEEKFLITKAHRDLEVFKKECIKLRTERDGLEKEVQHEKQKYDKLIEKVDHHREEIEKENANNTLKIDFLKKYIFSLQEKYCKYTPLIPLTNVTSLYAKFLNKTKEEGDLLEKYFLKIDEVVKNNLKSIEHSNESSDIVKMVQYEVKCNFLEDQLKINKQKLDIAEKELNAVQLAAIEEDEQWKTIKALFGEKEGVIETNDACIQTTKKDFNDASINTEDLPEVVSVEKEILEKADFEAQVPTPTIRRSLERQDTVIIQPIPKRQQSIDRSKLNEEIVSLENQLQQAKGLASKRSALLLDTENKLAEANGKIKELEKIIEEQKRTFKSENYNVEKKNSGIIETTITSLQSLLSEKDTTLCHYQELLKTEREQHFKSCETYDKEINALKKIQDENEHVIQNKNQEIENLTNQLENVDKKSLLSNSVNGTEKILKNDEFDQNCDNSLNEISDEKIEEMFLDESKNLTPPTNSHLFLGLINTEDFPIKHIHQFQMQIREFKNRELFWENSIRSKEEEIFILKEKLVHLQEREKSDINGNAEIDQLKVLLEEKDKHINDLMETLTSFHDDQQKFLSETSLYSADQMNQLGANLNRCEATNKILQTQLDALKKQLTTLSQREKQSRDLANSLRNQLIKRPVVPIKTETNSRVKNEQMQKRIQQLETDLDAAKKEIQQQQYVIDTKRAKNASEVSMWEKQKRHQQNAEKLKIKLEETEKSLEKTRSLLNAARTTINRLERDKNNLQASLLKGPRTPCETPDKLHIVKSEKCCQNSSCPNFQIVKIGHSFDSIERTTHCQSECSTDRVYDNNISTKFVDELKSKLEFQQRKIFALESVSKGSNAMVAEIEKLQERISSLEAQNIRWEAKNLQLQLDVDLMRQGDENDRNKKRIKHLEDYILALKEELANYQAEKDYTQTDKKSTTTTAADQTILALKRIIDRLKVENKTLKDGRSSHYPCKNDKEHGPEISRLNHLYAEAMNKISALQVELQLKSNSCIDLNGTTAVAAGDGDFMRELIFVKEQLVKKTQLLEKAKILLTRAAAKEKNLKDQLALWKRKCFELQNVPVIEEISE